MLPGITERQAALRARASAAALGGVADVEVAAAGPRPRRTPSARCASFEAPDLDGLLVVMLTYGPGDARRARCSRETRAADLPGQHPARRRRSRPRGTWRDLTYNQGIHGAQDTANAMVRAGRPFHVVTDDWRARRRSATRSGAGRAPPRRSRAGASLKVAVFGYAMNGMGDIRVDEHALLRALGPQVDALAPGDARTAPPRRSRADDVARADRRRGRALRDRPAALRATSARTTRACSSALEQLLRERRLRRLLDPLRRDRRGRPLRAAAARRRLEPDGQGLRLRAPRATR